MARLPPLSGKEVMRILAVLGYRKVRQRGSHFRLVCPGKKSITVPNYKTIGRGLLRKILRDAELSPAEFNKLINS
jgi:predicted RNA binding protein YcfA (HicA-like mRNA interferase family)